MAGVVSLDRPCPARKVPSFVFRDKPMMDYSFFIYQIPTWVWIFFYFLLLAVPLFVFENVSAISTVSEINVPIVSCYEVINVTGVYKNSNVLKNVKVSACVECLGTTIGRMFVSDLKFSRRVTISYFCYFLSGFCLFVTYIPFMLYFLLSRASTRILAYRLQLQRNRTDYSFYFMKIFLLSFGFLLINISLKFRANQIVGDDLYIPALPCVSTSSISFNSTNFVALPFKEVSNTYSFTQNKIIDLDFYFNGAGIDGYSYGIWILPIFCAYFYLFVSLPFNLIPLFMISDLSGKRDEINESTFYRVIYAVWHRCYYEKFLENMRFSTLWKSFTSYVSFVELNVNDTDAVELIQNMKLRIF